MINYRRKTIRNHFHDYYRQAIGKDGCPYCLAVPYLMVTNENSRFHRNLTTPYAHSSVLMWQSHALWMICGHTYSFKYHKTPFITNWDHPHHFRMRSYNLKIQQSITQHSNQQRYCIIVGAASFRFSNSNEMRMQTCRGYSITINTHITFILISHWASCACAMPHEANMHFTLQQRMKKSKKTKWI